MAVNVLIVDDDESVGTALATLLEVEGYRCECVATGPQALARIAATPFDVLLVDLRLREEDGMVVLKQLKAIAPGALGIILTGYGSVDAAIQSIEAGADDFLLKPVEIPRLKASIARGLDWRARLDKPNAELVRVNQQLLVEIAGRAVEEDLNRLKDEILAIASHDLKGPLTAIKGFAQALQRHMERPTPDLAQIAKGLRVIDAQADAMARLLDDLLDASRIQAGAMDLRSSPTAIRDCLDTVLRRLSAPDRGRIKVELRSAAVPVECDQKRIEQVLANLLANALKYSPEDQEITCTVEPTSSEVLFAVRDRGMGIPPEELVGLFERFHRTPQARASGLPGTGLGLYICRGIIEAHGGRIWAESEGEGRGTTFRFTLPVRLIPPLEAQQLVRDDKSDGA